MGKKIYEDTRLKKLASRGENQRVLELYLEEKLRVCGPGHPQGHGGTGKDHCQVCGDFRGDLARDWVETATKNGLKIPGIPPRRPLRPGETEEERRIDAARTRIRNFERTSQEYDWALTGIEATIAERRGMALPRGAYQTQGVLPI